MNLSTDFDRASNCGHLLAQGLSFEALRALGWDDTLMAQLVEGIEDLNVTHDDFDDEDDPRVTVQLAWLPPDDKEVPADFHQRLEDDERILPLVLCAFGQRRDPAEA